MILGRVLTGLVSGRSIDRSLRPGDSPRLTHREKEFPCRTGFSGSTHLYDLSFLVPSYSIVGGPFLRLVCGQTLSRDRSRTPYCSKR